MKINRFEDFECWQCARELCRLVFEITREKEFRKDFEIVKQINAFSGSQLYRVYDKGCISDMELERGLETVNKTINKTAAFAGYLRKSEYRGEKFK